MGTVKASNLEQAKQLLQSGDAIKLELDFELDSDEFLILLSSTVRMERSLREPAIAFRFHVKSSLSVIPAIPSITGAFVFSACDARQQNKTSS